MPIRHGLQSLRPCVPPVASGCHYQISRVYRLYPKGITPSPQKKLAPFFLTVWGTDSVLIRLQHVWQYAQDDRKRYSHYSDQDLFCQGFFIQNSSP
jgi:hypothetical protein